MPVLAETAIRRLARRAHLGASLLRLHRAYHFGLRAEVGAWVAKRRWLKASDLRPLVSNHGPIDCFMLLNRARFREGIWSLYSFRSLFGPCRLFVLNDGSLKEKNILALEQ